MKIKDLLNFTAFQGAEIVDYETIIDYEKEIEDVHSIQLNEEVETMDKYFALHRWLTVYLIVKEEK
jgi:hypothetical protein